MGNTDQDQLQEVYQKLEDGVIPVTEAIKQSSILTAKIATEGAVDAAGKRTRDIFINKDVQAAHSKFHEDNPDYTEVVESGKLQPYIDKNPLLVDNTIAYFQYKADQRGFKGEEKDKSKTVEESEKGKKFLSGDALEAEQMRTVLNMRDRRPTRQEPITLPEIEAQQMITLQKMRGKGE